MTRTLLLGGLLLLAFSFKEIAKPEKMHPQPFADKRIVVYTTAEKTDLRITVTDSLKTV